MVLQAEVALVAPAEEGLVLHLPRTPCEQFCLVLLVGEEGVDQLDLHLGLLRQLPHLAQHLLQLRPLLPHSPPLLVEILLVAKTTRKVVDRM